MGSGAELPADLSPAPLALLELLVRPNKRSAAGSEKKGHTRREEGTAGRGCATAVGVGVLHCTAWKPRTRDLVESLPALTHSYSCRCVLFRSKLF